MALNLLQEAAEALLTQLQKLRVEEKEPKGEEKKCKASGMECEDSSSSSSESSDSECEGVVNKKIMKRVTCKPKPVAENAPLMLSSMLTQGEVMDVQPVVVVSEPQPAIPDSIISLVKATEVGGIKKDETTSVAVGKKIEVCMGGKCKKSGAGVILEELERVVGMEGRVCGCKCLGKCKVGPNLRLSGTSSVNSPATGSLCLGVGLEDVRSIATNFLREELGLAASSS